MVKKTRLGDDADIYKHQEKKSELEKLKNLKGKDKFIYILDYYKLHIIGAALIIAILYTILSTVFNPPPECELYVTPINLMVEPQLLDECINDITSYLNLNTKTQEVVIDDSMNIDLDNIDSFTMSHEQKFSTYLYAREFDIIITDNAFFEQHASLGYFADLSDTLPKDLLEVASKDLMYSLIDETNETIPCGIKLPTDNKFSNYLATNKETIFCIAANSPETDNNILFLRYIYGLENNSVSKD